MDSLPEQFDLVVLGTGLPETILAAAASRAGKTVLQIDRNTYYGDEWASLSLEMMEQWVDKQSDTRDTDHYIGSFSNVEIVCPKDQLPGQTMQDLRKQSNRFAIDLSPRLIFSKGCMVDLLVQSNICRYLEFKNCTRVIVLKKALDSHQWIQVPCTRDAVFTTDQLSLIQKRKFMKFVDRCMQLQHDHAGEAELTSQSFVSFLQTNGLDCDLIEMVSSVTDSSETAAKGLQCLGSFIQSAGVFGPTPYLWPLYGCGELPQAFARLSAVFGGVYCLGQDAAVIDSHDVGARVTIGSNCVSCTAVVGSVSSLPANLLQLSDHITTSHAILITNASIHGSEHNEITCARMNVHGSEVSVIEVDSGSQSVPSGLFLIYMSCTSKRTSAKDDLLPSCAYLFPGEEDSPGAHVLWSCFFNKRSPQKISCTKKHVYAFSGPSAGVDYELHVNEAKSLFHDLFPEDRFLPRAPDAEDIVIDDELERSPE